MTSWLFAVLGSAAYVVGALGIGAALGRLTMRHPRTDRALVTERIGRALAGQTVALLLLGAWLATRRWSLTSLGLTQPGTLAGWIAAIAVVAVFGIALLRGPLRQVAKLDEWTAFRAGGAAMAALVGAFEESVFRAFAMNELASAAVHPALQVVVAAALWSGAHIRWGRRARGYDWRLAVGALSNTFVLGIAFGVVYLVGGRSLWPAIAAHSGLNLLVEPWLALAALTGRLGRPSRTAVS
jgi:hypothetical protein